MLGLYLYTLIISHKSSNMLRILNKLTLYQELQAFVTNNLYLDKKVKSQQQQNKKSNIKNSCWSRGFEPGTSCTQSGCVTTAPPSQLGVSIVVKLLNCFNNFSTVIGWLSQLRMQWRTVGRTDGRPKHRIRKMCRISRAHCKWVRKNQHKFSYASLGYLR